MLKRFPWGYSLGPSEVTKMNSEKPGRIRAWVTELRLPFLTGSIMPIILGTIIAWNETHGFYLDLFLLTLIAGVCLHLGANVSNDYFDHLNRTDDINVDYIRPFSGGARMIQEGLLTPRAVLAGSLVLFAIAGVIGLYLFSIRGIVLLVLGGIGAFSGFFYTAPPFRFVTRGIGEIFIGLNFGVLMTFGAFYVQNPVIIPEPIVASLPLAILITAVLFINQFPDSKADEAAGKRTLVVRLGPRGAATGYFVLAFSVYVAVMLGVGLMLLTMSSMLVVAIVPLAVLGSRTALAHYSSPTGLIPAYAATVTNHLLTGVALSVANLLDGIAAQPWMYLAAGIVLFAVSVALAEKIASVPVPPTPTDFAQ